MFSGLRKFREAPQPTPTCSKVTAEKGVRYVKSTRNTIEFGFLSVEDISLTLAAHVSQTKTDITLLTHASCVCHQCFYLGLFS